jgi:hypothetical protein
VPFYTTCRNVAYIWNILFCSFLYSHLKYYWQCRLASKSTGIQRYKVRMCKRLELPYELLAVIVFINGTKSKQVWKCSLQWVFDISVLEEAVTSFDFRNRQMCAILFQIDTRIVLCHSATCWELGLAGCSTVLRCPKSSLSCSTRQLRLSLPASSWGCRSRGAILYQRKFNENDLVYLDCW